nr:conotoxin precursor O2 [Conus judaeus]UMA83851.1 conotoxin precursor O2 [Conus judaeus]
MEKLMILMVVAAMLVLTQVKVQGDQGNSPKDVRERLRDSFVQRVRRCLGHSQPCNEHSECCAPCFCGCTTGSVCNKRCQA